MKDYLRTELKEDALSSTERVERILCSDGSAKLLQSQQLP